MSKLFISPTQVLEAVRELAERNRVDEDTKIWGVPRGGVPVALALAALTSATIVGSPSLADLIVDDIYDSGKTAARYRGPFDILFDKRQPLWAGQWIVLPWEVSEEHDDSATDAVVRLLQYIGEDVSREGLKETPARVLKAWSTAWGSGYDIDPSTILKTFEDGSEDYDEFVFQGSVPFFSHCEHHVTPIWGVAHIGYIPDGRIVGLSKLSRLLEVFSRRLQTQERISTQVVNALMEHLRPLGAGVVLQARHHCMESRGIHKIGTITTTSALRGVVKDRPEVRSEFMSFVSTASQGLRNV